MKISDPETDGARGHLDQTSPSSFNREGKRGVVNRLFRFIGDKYNKDFALALWLGYDDDHSEYM